MELALWIFVITLPLSGPVLEHGDLDAKILAQEDQYCHVKAMGFVKVVLREVGTARATLIILVIPVTNVVRNTVTIKEHVTSC